MPVALGFNIKSNLLISEKMLFDRQTRLTYFILKWVFSKRRIPLSDTGTLKEVLSGQDRNGCASGHKSAGPVSLKLLLIFAAALLILDVDGFLI